MLELLAILVLLVAVPVLALNAGRWRREPETIWVRAMDLPDEE